MQNPTSGAPRRVCAVLVLAALSVITGIISYEHGLIMARETSNTGLVCYLLPLVPDLMIVGGSITLVEASARHLSRPLPAIGALVAGIGWTVAQNIAGGWHGGAGDRVVSGGIPLAFLVTFESLLWLLRQGRQSAAATTGNHSQPPRPETVEDGLALLLDIESQRTLAEALGVPRSRVQAWQNQIDTARDSTPPAIANHS
jgi:hypothetical protein